MVWRWNSCTAAKSSPWLMALLLLGALTWLAPMVSAARRSRVPHSQDVILTVQSPGELCIRGTSVAEGQRIALIGGQTVALGERVQLEDRFYRVNQIESDFVRLRPVKDATASRRATSMVR